MSTAATLMTAAEFIARHGHESGVELVRGYLVRLPMPGGRHGEVCDNAAALFRGFVKPNGLGRTMTNDTFVRTRIDPDTYRGADVCYLSYERWPKDRPLPDGPLETPPDLVVEVKAPSDRWGGHPDQGRGVRDGRGAGGGARPGVGGGDRVPR
ncbi:MAG: Uma2 family endonuclease [Gemmataceae bacterium]